MTGKPKPARLWLEITLTLVLKVAVLAIIWAAWFSSPEEHDMDDQKVAEQILSRQSIKEHDNGSVHRTR